MQILKSQTNNHIAKVWVGDLAHVESAALDQIRLMLEFPRLFGHIAIMPDVHLGAGAVIGGVVVTEGAVVPNIVGVDIGCGMTAINTGIHYDRELMGRSFWRSWKGQVDRAIPTGFHQHENAQLMVNLEFPLQATELLQLQESKAPFQLGTLGGGNHFLEAQYDENDMVWMMVHSGSRHIGLRIAGHYNKLAAKLNERWASKTPKDLWFLPLGSDEGQDYLADMRWALAYALENRWRMLQILVNEFLSACGLASITVRIQGINIHHNFAAIENHRGENVVVHRKGATQAKPGQVGIIPGSMGSPSYIVKGLGNPDSYMSCSHGAGRTMSRSAAKKTISEADFAESVKATFTSPSAKYLDEAPGAYKDIDAVMANQADLVEVRYRLTPIITIKGEGD